MQTYAIANPRFNLEYFNMFEIYPHYERLGHLNLEKRKLLEAPRKNPIYDERQSKVDELYFSYKVSIVKHGILYRASEKTELYVDVFFIRSGKNDYYYADLEDVYNIAMKIIKAPLKPAELQFFSGFLFDENCILKKLPIPKELILSIILKNKIPDLLESSNHLKFKEEIKELYHITI